MTHTYCTYISLTHCCVRACTYIQSCTGVRLKLCTTYFNTLPCTCTYVHTILYRCMYVHTHVLQHMVMYKYYIYMHLGNLTFRNRCYVHHKGIVYDNVTCNGNCYMVSSQFYHYNRIAVFMNFKYCSLIIIQL